MGQMLRGLASVVGSGAVLLALAACTPPEPPPETATEAVVTTSAPEAAVRAPVTFTATDFKYEGPASIPAGMTEVELVNQGQSNHALVIVGLGDGKTKDDILAILDQEGSLPDWVTFAGGVGGIPPGARASVVHDLAPGRYAIFSFESAEGEETSDAAKGMIQELEVTAADGTAAELPEADLTVDMHDWRFETRGAFRSGPQTIAVHNKGEQPHEALVMKLNQGVAAGDVVKMISEFAAAGGPPEEGAAAGGTPTDGTVAGGTPAAAAPEDAPPEGAPFASAGGLGPIDPGESAFVTLDLEPGNYMIICFIPDAADGTMHLAKGMFHEFSVQ